MNSLEINNVFYKLHSSFESMTKKEFLAVQTALIKSPNKTAAKVNVLLKLFHEPAKAKKALQFININDKTWVLQVTDFVFDVSNYAQILSDKIPNSHYFGMHQKLYPPVDFYENIDNWTFFEFVKCYAYYQKFVRTQNSKFLNLLCAVIYRPKAQKKQDDEGKQLDNRIPFDDATLLERAKKFAKVAPAVKNTIFMYFLGQFEQLAKAHPDIFQRTESTSAQNAPTNWVRITFALADSNALDMEKYLQKTTSFVLVSLSEKINQQKAQKNNIK